MTVIGSLELVRRNVAERFEQAPRVVPRDPLERRELDLFHPLPRPAPPDLFGLVEPDDRFRERVVVRIAGAADRGLDAGLGETLGVPNRQILRPTVAVMDERVR